MPTEVAVNSAVTGSIARAEGISLPVLLILLVLIFGSVVAAALPVAIGGLAILGSFAVLRLLSLTTTVAIYSVNITTILGLGLGIDYGLFMVKRFREELRRQPTVEAAVARTVATAGRTILVSGVTVALALTSLMLFPEVFLRSMGYGGVATVAVDVIAAVTVLPALLAVLGHRVNALRVRKSVGAAPKEDDGAWYRLAHSVMRRPVAFASVIVVVLLALGAPFLKISWGGTDSTVLPASSTVRQVSDTLASEFPANSTTPIEAVVSNVTSGDALTGYVSKIDAIPGVTGTQVTGERDGTRTTRRRLPPAVLLAAGPADRHRDPGPRAPAARHRPRRRGDRGARRRAGQPRVHPALDGAAHRGGDVRAALPRLRLGGAAAEGDRDEHLSLSATFGVLVWVFQGAPAGLLRFSPATSTRRCRVLLAIVFGLSMDYEVFMLSRIRERYDGPATTRSQWPAACSAPAA